MTQAPRTNAGQWSDTLQRLLDGLKSKNDDARLAYQLKLRRYVATMASDLTQEMFSKFMNELIRSIQDLVNSNVTAEKVGG
jgi:FKBP12-rapamycin complex-associated protein